MRVLFIVVSKVFGLVQAYSGLAYILTMLPFMRMLVNGSPDDNSAASMHTTFYGESLTLNAISISAMIVITFSVAWIMIFQAEWLADKLRIPATDTSAPFPVERLLGIGTKLIGLFILVQGIPSFINALIELRQMMLFGSHTMASLIPPLLRIVIGVILVTKTDAIMKVMTRTKE
jgi:hypothetical protein